MYIFGVLSFIADKIKWFSEEGLLTCFYQMASKNLQWFGQRIIFSFRNDSECEFVSR